MRLSIIEIIIMFITIIIIISNIIFSSMFIVISSRSSSSSSSSIGSSIMSRGRGACWQGPQAARQQPPRLAGPTWPSAARIGRGDDTVGNPHRAQISQLELFEFILLLKLDKQFSIEQFEPTVSRSTVPSPPLGGVGGVGI